VARMRAMTDCAACVVVETVVVGVFAITPRLYWKRGSVSTPPNLGENGG